MSTTSEEPQTQEAAVTTPDASEDPSEKKAKLEAEVSQRAGRIMKHMNSDHEDSLVAYVLAFATGVEVADTEKDLEDALLRNILGGKLVITSVQITAVDTEGFLLQVKASENSESEVLVLSNVRVPFDKPIESAKEIHQMAVSMHRKAYDKLGVWYKTKNGYYKQVAKFIAMKSYMTVKKSSTTTTVFAGVAAVGAATLAAGYLRHRSRTSL